MKYANETSPLLTSNEKRLLEFGDQPENTEENDRIFLGRSDVEDLGIGWKMARNTCVTAFWLGMVGAVVATGAIIIKAPQCHKP